MNPSPNHLKSYAFVDIDVHEPQAYASYMSLSGPAVSASGGRFLIRGGDPAVLEGGRNIQRIVVVEFDGADGAATFYGSEPYQAAIPFRSRSSLAHYTLLQGNHATADVPHSSLPRTPLPKGYLYAEIYPNNLEKYMHYPKLSTPVVEQFGGTFLVRGGSPVVKEGDRKPERIVLVQFESPEVAKQFYFSDDYQAAMRWRTQYSTGHVYLLTGT
jgi:uncharacterized protein (DUF1330 family)